MNNVDPSGEWDAQIHWVLSYYSAIRYMKKKWTKIVADASRRIDYTLSALNSSKNWKYHFPGYGCKKRSLILLWNAISFFNQGKTKRALENLGYALHAIQDYYAHPIGKYGPHMHGVNFLYWTYWRNWGLARYSVYDDPASRRIRIRKAARATRRYIRIFLSYTKIPNA